MGKRDPHLRVLGIDARVSHVRSFVVGAGPPKSSRQSSQFAREDPPRGDRVFRLQGLAMEPEIRIKWNTCGLRISPNPTSDNLTPQQTTNQDAPDMGADWADLSCPGSSLVAERARFENCDALETIEHNLYSSVHTQLLTEQSEADETPIKRHRIR